jgi:exosortase
MILVAAFFNYGGMFRYTAFLFNHPLEDMSHGWVVPFVSLFAVWRQRLELRRVAGPPSWAGAACVAFFLVVAWFGGRGEQTRIEQVSFIGLSWAIPYAFWGRGVERLMRFPAAYLLFTIPMSSFLDFLTLRLRMVSVAMATGILNGVGMAVERSGTAIFSQVPGGTFNVDVAEPCSGIRSLFAMMTLFAAYAYFTQKGRWAKLIMCACSVPIAVLGNMVRIMSICVVASWFGQDVATGYYHDYSGFVTFSVGVCLMVSFNDWLRKTSGRFKLVSSKTGEPDTLREGGGTRRSAVPIIVGVTVVSVALFAAGFLMPAPELGTTDFVSKSLPEQVDGFAGDVPWFCQDSQCLEVAEQRGLTKKTVDGVVGYACPMCGKRMATKSLGESTILPSDTLILKRNYRAADGVIYAVSVVIQGRSRGGLHRAEVCLPSQGYVIENERRMAVNMEGRPRPLRVREIDALKPMKGARMPVRQDGQLVWFDKADGENDLRGYAGKINLFYWLFSGDRECCSHAQRILTDVWDRSLHNRINRWVMVAVNVSPAIDSEESRTRFEAFVSDLFRNILVKQ